MSLAKYVAGGYRSRVDYIRGRMSRAEEGTGGVTSFTLTDGDVSGQFFTRTSLPDDAFALEGAEVTVAPAGMSDRGFEVSSISVVRPPFGLPVFEALDQQGLRLYSATMSSVPIIKGLNTKWKPFWPSLKVGPAHFPPIWICKRSPETDASLTSKLSDNGTLVSPPSAAETALYRTDDFYVLVLNEPLTETQKAAIDRALGPPLVP